MSSPSPLVTIVVLIRSDTRWTSETLQSCLDQTLAPLEILCVVDRASAKATRDLIPRDDRVRVIEHEGDGTTREALRAGVAAASAPYVMFLRLGDELHPDAAVKVHGHATRFDADIVEFGIETAESPAGSGPSSATLVPEHARLNGVEILRRLFPPSSPTDTRLWRLAFRAERLRAACAALPPAGLSESWADDVLVVLLTAAEADTYVSFNARIYRHFPSRGSDGLPVAADDRMRAAVETIAVLDAVAPLVRSAARHHFNPEPLVDAYESTRLAAIGQAVALSERSTQEMRDEVRGALRSSVSSADVVTAAAAFAPDALASVTEFADHPPLRGRNARSVLLTTNVLTMGGVSSVLISQAQVLLAAGYRVTILAHRRGSDMSLVPEGATLVELLGSGKSERLRQWTAHCREFEIDLVIDHRIMYSRDWPAYALVANALDAATIGWIHAFSGRPTYNGTDLLSLLQDNLGALAQLVVLSPLDVAFWKLRGVEHVAYLPNPPSSLIVDSLGAVTPRSAPRSRRIELVWWGRLDETTKKVTHLIEVAVALKRAGADFRLRIVGPDWNDTTAASLTALARKRGVEGVVELTGARHGQSLVDTIDSSDVFINTSIIEGYLLTIPEAQSRGLPVVMYELPWLLPVQENPGVIPVAQGDARALANAVLALIDDPDRYEELSRASIDAAERIGAVDFDDLYQKLVLGDLPDEFSPAPSMESGQQILDLLIFFAENRPAPAPTGGSGSKRRGRTASTAGRRHSAGPQTLAATIERRLTGPGQRAIDRAPWIRPAARRVKSALLRIDTWRASQGRGRKS